MANSLLQGLAGGARGLQQVLQLMAGQKFREQERSGQQEDALARLRARFRLEGDLRSRLAEEEAGRAVKLREEQELRTLREQIAGLEAELPITLLERPEGMSREQLFKARLDLADQLGIRARDVEAAQRERAGRESDALIEQRRSSAAASRGLAQVRGDETLDEGAEGLTEATVRTVEKAVRDQLNRELEDLQAWAGSLQEQVRAGAFANVPPDSPLHPLSQESRRRKARLDLLSNDSRFEGLVRSGVGQKLAIIREGLASGEVSPGVTREAFSVFEQKLIDDALVALIQGVNTAEEIEAVMSQMPRVGPSRAAEIMSYIRSQLG